MKNYFFSPATKGFYLPSIHGAGNMPPDVLPVSAESHRALLEAQSQGKVIGIQGGSVVAQEPPAIDLESAVRAERNSRLADTDWTQLADVPKETRAAWAPYRQALRDVPRQSGFPGNAKWPEIPK